MKITLCGSTRFKNEYIDANTRLTKAGHVVYTVSTMMHADQVDLTTEEKENLDLVHLAKILNSDAICVVGQKEDGTPYIGESTRREIIWAQMHEKLIYWGTKDLLEGDFPDILTEIEIPPPDGDDET